MYGMVYKKVYILTFNNNKIISRCKEINALNCEDISKYVWLLWLHVQDISVTMTYILDQRWSSTQKLAKFLNLRMGNRIMIGNEFKER